MATRFYLTTTPYTANTPVISTQWTSSANLVRRKMVPFTPSGTALANKSAAVAGASGDFHLYVQFVSPPLDGAYTFTASAVTNSIVMRWSESDALANCFMQSQVRIVSNDGTVLRDNAGFNTDGTEFATSLTARTFTGTSSLLDYTTVAGDRLVIEVGFQKNSTTSYTITTNYGDNAAADLTISTSDTGADNPYFECELNLGFQSEDTNTNQLMMTGCGT